MVDQIKQEFIFDASQAISSLDLLDASLKSSRDSLNNFGRSVTSFNRRASSATTSMSKLAAEAASLRTSLSGGIIPTSTVSNVQKASGLVDQFGNALGSQTTAAQAATNATQTVAKTTAAAGKAANNAKKGVNSLNLTFESLAKTVITRVVTGAITAFIRVIAEAQTRAIEFQKRIAEIQSISENAFGTFDRTANAVRDIADAFNQPLGEVQEGLYQTISNQIQGAANQIEVLSAASNLAKVGVADLSNTVGLLTGTINAFELNAADANQIAAVFFETVRLGRTRISELATSFGTVAPLAAEAGVEFEELAAAFASVTINGINTAKAATQLRGIINAFVKPTKELSAVLQEAGFSSGELAIQTLGLGGALALLQEASGGSTTELAKLVPRVRGLSGTLVLARNDGADLEKTIDSLRLATDDLLRQKLDIRLETNAEQVEAELSRITNALTVDLGQSILGATKRFLELTGGSRVLATSIQVLGPALVAVGSAALIAAAGLATYTVAVKTAAATNTALAASGRAVGIALVKAGASANLARSLLAFAGSAVPLTIGFSIGAAIGVGLNNALEQSARRAGQRAADAASEELLQSEIGTNLDAFRQETNERIRLIKDVTREQVKALNEVRRTEEQRTRIFLDSNDVIFADTERLFDALSSANKKLISDLQRERDAADRAAESSLERQANLRSTIEDRAFKQSIANLSERRRLLALEAQGARLAADANRALARAQNQTEADAALDTRARAEGFLQEAEAIARSSNNIFTQNKLFQARQQISRTSLKAEQQFERTQKRIQENADAALKTEKERVASLNREVKEAQDAISAFRQARTLEEQITAAREARTQIQDITPELAFGDGTLDFSQLVSFGNFQRNLRSELDNAGLQRGVGNLLGGVDLTRLTTQFTQETTRAVLEGVQEAEEIAGRVGFDLDVSLNLDQSSVAQLQNALNQLQTGSGAAQGVLGDSVEREVETVRRIDAAQGALIQAAAEANNGASRLVNLIGDLALTANLSAGGFVGGTSEFENALIAIRGQVVNIANDFENITPQSAELQLNRLLSLFQEIDSAANFAQRAEANVLRSEVDNLIRNLLEANESGLDQATENSAEINNQLSQTPAAGAAYNQQLELALGTATQIANTLNSAGTAVVPQVNAAIGRYVPKFLAGGGFSPRGTDTVPAMLSPGEFVMNARSTKRFYSQLQAMNAGVRPVFRQEGGPVTNVGDINVSISQEQSRSIDGRQIAHSIRRELRRGTSSL